MIYIRRVRCIVLLAAETSLFINKMSNQQDDAGLEHASLVVVSRSDQSSNMWPRLAAAALVRSVRTTGSGLLGAAEKPKVDGGKGK